MILVCRASQHKFLQGDIGNINIYFIIVSSLVIIFTLNAPFLPSAGVCLGGHDLFWQLFVFLCNLLDCFILTFRKNNNNHNNNKLLLRLYHRRPQLRCATCNNQSKSNGLPKIYAVNELVPDFHVCPV